MACNRRTPRGCACSFSGGFSYGDIAGGCLLYFIVRNLKNGCTPIDFSTANITVELFLNGSPISEPLIPYTDSSGETGGTWEKWKPTANDVYSAVVTLTCSDSSVVVKEYSITIPDPANTNCNCCTERVPDYVTISGLTGVFALLNGTWALSFASTCTYDAGPTVGTSDPADPCFGGTHLLSCTSGANTFYFYPPKSNYPAVTVVMPGTSGKITISFGAFYSVWRYRPLFTDCINTGSGSCQKFAINWVYEIDCETGEATLLSRTEGLGSDSGSAGSTLVSGIPNPTVNLVLAS